MDTMYDVFVSHNGLDKPVVERLCWALLEAGLRPWFDKWDLAPGHAWMREVERVLGRIPAVIMCVGANGISAWHDAERQAALDRSTASGSISVIPVLLPGAPQSVELPLFLRGRVVVDLRMEVEWDDGIARLVASLEGKARPPGSWTDDGRERPYRGLQPFTEADAGWMFGREREEDELLDALREGQRFITVVGASGSGKSSLVRAGVVPAVRTGAFDGQRRWRVLVMRPGARPCHALAVRLGELRRNMEAAGTDLADESARVEALREQLLASESKLSNVADLLLDRDDHDHQLLLVVDQFEELFTEPTYGAGKLAPEAAALLRNLLYATAREDGRVRVMTTLRADFTGDCLAVPELGRRMTRLSFALPPMAAEQLREAIRRPALRMGYDVEQALMDALLGATIDQAGRLPLLQHALDLLWDARDKPKRRLTYAAYAEHVGSIDDAVARRAESVFEALVKRAPSHEEVVRRVFLRLVHQVEDTRYTRRRMRRRELVGEAAAFVLEAYVEARLVVTDELHEREDAVREQVAEIAHEALIGRWSRLQRWLDGSREVLRMRQEIGIDAKQWERRGRVADELWRGGHLAHGREMLGEEDIGLSPLEQEFLEASKAAEAAEQRVNARRQRRLLAAATAASFVLLVLLAIAIVQYVGAAQLAERNLALAEEKDAEAARAATAADEARRQEAHAARLRWEEQSAHATLLASVPGKELEALELAVEAVGGGSLPSVKVTQGLHAALLGAREVVTIRGEKMFDLAEWSPDGRRLAVANSDLTLQIWDAETGHTSAPLRGHTDPINVIAWSPDGKRLASGSNRGTIRLWDGAAAKSVAVLEGHGDGVVEIAWSPNGMRLASLGSGFGDSNAWERDGGVVKLWDGRTGALLATLAGHWSSAVDLEWSPGDGARLATAHAVGWVQLWNGTTGEPALPPFIGHTEPVTSVAWSPDGARLASASRDETARLWDPTTGKSVQILEGHQGPVIFVSWQPGGTRLATASHDKTVRLWDGVKGEALATLSGHDLELGLLSWADDGSRIATVWGGGTYPFEDDRCEVRIWDSSGAPLANPQGHRGLVSSATWSPNGSRFAVGTFDKMARIWNADTGELLTTLAGHTEGVAVVSWSPNGQHLATGSLDGTARIWSTDTAEVLGKLEGHIMRVNRVAWSPEGSRLATTGFDGSIKLWDPATAKATFTIDDESAEKYSIEWSPDGTRLVSWSREAPRLWDATSGAELGAFQGHMDRVFDVVWSPDGSRLATASADGTARLWDPFTQRELLSLLGHTDAVVDLSWSPDGSKVVTASTDETARIWDARSGERLISLEGHAGAVGDVHWSPDGSRVVTRGDGDDDSTARVWRADTGKLLASLGDLVSAVAWSPDGKRLVATRNDGSLRLWDAVTLEPLASHQGNSDVMWQLAWAPDASRFATGSLDGVVVLWDGETATPLATFRGHTNRISSVAWSPDGLRLATSSVDGTTRLWPGTLRGWLVRACEILEGSRGAIELRPPIKTLCATNRTTPTP